MIDKLISWIKYLFGIKPLESYAMDDVTRKILNEKVEFYRSLKEADKRLFEQRVLMFINNTSIVGQGTELTDADCLLVASSAIIPVWAFPRWHYFNLRQVTLVPASFNSERQFGQPDSNITGMVGTGPMSGKMLLSKPALHYGFLNAVDKKNVGIHEFAHLIDMADGNCDGFPERLSQYAFFAPWLNFVENKISQIKNKKTNINAYGATNEQEFFSVTTEYFFEKPKMLKAKHPELYQHLMAFYKQDTAAIEKELKPKKNAPCPCGSQKKYKRCCLPAA